MNIGKFLMDNLEYIVIAPTPLIVYGLIKLKKYKICSNDLTPYVEKLNRKKEDINNRSKAKLF